MSIEPTIRRNILKVLASLAMLSTTATLSFAQGTHLFDLSPEQKNRIRAEKDAAAIAALPKNFKFVKDGVLTVAIHASALPISSYASDTRTVIGGDPDIAQLIADALGLKLELVPIAWADWPLGLSSGKYDAVISNVGVTEERKLKFDFSTYRLGLHGFYVPKNSPIQSLQEAKDVAGLKIITSSGTIQERILIEWDKRNRAAGLKPLELVYFDDEAARNIALLSGRADAQLNPRPYQAYFAAKEGKTREVGTVNAGWPSRADVAVTTRKGSGLAPAITAAINGLIRNGAYGRALARWSLQTEALPQSETNPPGLARF